MRTANPALNSNTFTRVQPAAAAQDAMTVQGTVNRTLILLTLCLIGATWTWSRFFDAPSQAATAAIAPWMVAGLIGGLVFSLITIFKASWSPVTAPVYAVCEGLFLGGVSGIFESQFPGIVIQAVGLTFGTLLALLLAYTSGLIRASENFKLGVVAATGAICLVYLASWILGFFSINIPYIHSSGTFGILFSGFVVVVAALNLVLDFDFIETGVSRGAPKYMEWYSGFGLLVTLVWLYIEILRLLAKLKSRD